MNSHQTVAVTGATGFVGRHVVRALAARGHSVRALARDASKARSCLVGAKGDVQVVMGDVFDRATVRDLCRGCSAMVHTIGIRREIYPKATFERMHPVATSLVLAGATESGIGRFVHMSALGVRPEAPTDYQRSKYASEMLVKQSGLDWTILRPGLIHGPDGELMQMIKSWVLGRTAPYFFLPYFLRVEGKPPAPPKFVSATVAPVSVLDVAESVVASLENPDSVGEVYELTGPEHLDWPEMLKLVRDSMPLTDRRKKPRGLPGRLGWLIAKTAKPLGLANALPFGPSEPLMATENSLANTAKAAAHLGFNPRPFRSLVRDYADSI